MCVCDLTSYDNCLGKDLYRARTDTSFNRIPAKIWPLHLNEKSFIIKPGLRSLHCIIPFNNRKVGKKICMNTIVFDLALLCKEVVYHNSYSLSHDEGQIAHFNKQNMKDK